MLASGQLIDITRDDFNSRAGLLPSDIIKLSPPRLCSTTHRSLTAHRFGGELSNQITFLFNLNKFKEVFHEQ